MTNNIGILSVLCVVANISDSSQLAIMGISFQFAVPGFKFHLRVDLSSR